MGGMSVRQLSSILVHAAIRCLPALSARLPPSSAAAGLYVMYLLAGLGALLLLGCLHAERAVTESIDAKWADEGWDVNASVFNPDPRSARDPDRRGTEARAGQ
jgi:hypothetical protein